MKQKEKSDRESALSPFRKFRTQTTLSRSRDTLHYSSTRVQFSLFSSDHRRHSKRNDILTGSERRLVAVISASFRLLAPSSVTHGPNEAIIMHSSSRVSKSPQKADSITTLSGCSQIRRSDCAYTWLSINDLLYTGSDRRRS